MSSSTLPLATLAYRSYSPTPLTAADLAKLVLAAQERNRAESITGLLIYEDGHFFQWLEGPAANLSRVWASIRTDARHVDIEVLGDAPIGVRFFGDWNLKFAVRQAKCADASPSRRTIRSKPLATPVTVPALARLARQLIASDPGEAFEQVSRFHQGAGSLEDFYSSVIEPSARNLGNLWSSDDCSELDVTVGMSRLQTALRRSATSKASPAASKMPRGTVLVVPQPRELHMLAAVLDAEVLWQNGWAIHCDFPATDRALQEVLGATWFDALDLTTSLAFRREHLVSRLTNTIRHARAASRNPNLRVVVSGRLFFESPEAINATGADAASGSASQIDALLKPAR